MTDLSNVTIARLSQEVQSRGWRLIPQEHAERLMFTDPICDKGFRSGFWPKIREEKEKPNE